MPPVRALLPIAALAALACAGPRRPAAPAAPAAVAAPPPAFTPAAPAPRAVARGMSAAEVRRALGAPVRVERVASAASPTAAYERWVYPDREVILLDGQVIDAVP